ncbi:MAG: type IV secretion system protein, partial [Acidobacteriota bacterium]|nr:type IV secretion system protein [Acidobacteriota bacterium]
IVVLAFTGITIQFIVAMVESYIIVAAGFIFLGFGGSRWTAPYTERYIGLAVSIGLKIMLLYLLIGTGMNLSVDWMTDAQKVSMAINPAMSAFEIMGASLIFLMLCWQIPKLFSAVLGGAPALTGGDLLSTGTGIVAGAATIASLGAGAAAFAGRGAAAIAGVGAAANAGAGSSGAGAGTAGLGFGGSTGRSGGGSVPPPSHPGPSSNGGPQQPNHPKRGGGSGGASADLATVGSSSNGTPGSRNGSGGPYGSNGNGHHGNGTARSTGSGATDHAAWLADAGSTDAARSVASNLSVGDPVMWSPDGSAGIPSGDGVAPSRAPAPGIVAGFGRSGKVMVRACDGAMPDGTSALRQRPQNRCGPQRRRSNSHTALNSLNSAVRVDRPHCRKFNLREAPEMPDLHRTPHQRVAKTLVRLAARQTKYCPVRRDA